MNTDKIKGSPLHPRPSASIRGEAKLNCDARTAFLSEAPIYYMNSAARNRRPIDFTPVQLTP